MPEPPPVLDLQSISSAQHHIPEAYDLKIEIALDEPATRTEWLSFPEDRWAPDADPVFVWDYRKTTTDQVCVVVTDVRDDRFEVLHPIHVHAYPDPAGGWVACLAESPTTRMPGDSMLDAIRALQDDMVDAFDIYSEEHYQLGPGPAREWYFLKRHLRYK